MHGTSSEAGDDRDVGRHLARVAHELRTPVSVIAGSLENLQESIELLVRYVTATEKYLDAHDEPARLRRDLQLDYRIENTPGLLRICSDGARRLRHVVDQIGQHSVVSVAAAEQSSDLATVLRSAVDLVLCQHGGGLSVRWNLAPELPRVRGGEQALGQVFVNVVRNASDAVREVPNPQLEVIATRALPAPEAAEDCVEVRFRDNGPGLSSHVVERAFDEFFTTKRAGAGAGLGLAISRDIVRALGGDIVVGNLPAGGAEVRVLLAAAPSR